MNFGIFLEKMVDVMRESFRLRPILIKVVLNFSALLFILLIHNYTATSAYQVKNDSYITSYKLPFNHDFSRIELQDDIDIDKKDQPFGVVEKEVEDVLEIEEEWPERVAFLTFDDGPSMNTHRLLDILSEENVPSIFFLLGKHMTAHPDSQMLLERMITEGHYIGLHSMTHDFWSLYRGYGAPERFVGEMNQLQELIYDMVGHHTDLCRAPYGMMSGFTPYSGHAEAVAEAGIYCIDWNVDPQDWRNYANADLILQDVIDQVHRLNFPSELVVVLHEEDVTVESLAAIIAFLREHDYVFKTYQPGYEFIYQQYRYRIN